jgi:hypothetical protein
VVDIGHHDGYSAPLKLLPGAARRLHGLPEAAAALIRDRLAGPPPSAFRRLAADA